MGIACDIAEDLLRPVERRFAVDDPFGVAERREVAKEGSPRSQGFPATGVALLVAAPSPISVIEQTKSPFARLTSVNTKKQ